MLEKGKLIVFTGIKGAGKNSVMGFINDELLRLGKNPLMTREKKGTRLGFEIHHFLVGGDLGMEISTQADFLLRCAKHMDLCQNIIQPAIARNKIVLCNGFLGWEIGIDVKQQINFTHISNEMVNLIGIGSFFADFVKPDLIILLDVDPGTGLTRSNSWHDEVFFQKGEDNLNYYHQLRKNFLCIEAGNKTAVRINSNQPLEKVQQEVLDIILNIL